MLAKLFTLPLLVFILVSTVNYCRNDLNEEFKVELMNTSQIKNLIQERNGKVLLLNLWATWCVPCREEFPELIKLQKQSGNQNFEIVAISIDYPDELDSKVIPFVISQKINFKIYVADAANDSELINLLNPEWNGALPATFIYNRNGKQTGFLLGKGNFYDFKKEIEKAKTR